MPVSTHYFDSTGEAYNASQTRDEIRDGDVLVVVPEGVVGVMISAWPTAVTETTGEFHGLDPELGWDAIPAGWDNEIRDYSASHAVALDRIAELKAADELKTSLTSEELAYIDEERHLIEVAAALGVELTPTRRYEDLMIRKAAEELGLAEELGIDLHSIRADRTAGEVI